MVLGFSERRKSFSSSFSTQKFYIKLFFQMQSTFSVSSDLLSFNCRRYHWNVPYAAMALLKFNFSRWNTSKATLFTQLNNRRILISGPVTKSIIFNSSYKIYCVKCPWFWFWLVFVLCATWAVFFSMDKTLDVMLPPWVVISNSALKGNSL